MKNVQNLKIRVILYLMTGLWVGDFYMTLKIIIW